MTKIFVINDLGKVLTAEELRMLLRAMPKEGGITALRDYAWISLVLNTGIKPSILTGLTVAHAEYAIRNNRLPDHARCDLELNDAAAWAIKDLLSIRHELGLVNKPDGPLLVSRKHGAAPSVRALEQRIDYWRDATFISRKITINHLIHTHNAKKFVEMYGYLLEFDKINADAET